MSIVKLAAQPIIVINKTDPNNNTGSSKTFNAKNIAAAVVGGTSGFGLSEAVERSKHFNKAKLSHQYARRMGSVLGGFVGAAGTYALLNKKSKEEQDPKFYML